MRTMEQENSSFLKQIEENGNGYSSLKSIPRNVVLNFNLTLSDLKVFIYLVDEIGYGKREAVDYLGISDGSGLSLRQVKDSIVKLEKAGCIKKYRSVRSNNYYINRFEGASIPFSENVFKCILPDETIYSMRYLFLSNGNDSLPSIKYCSDNFNLSKFQRSKIAKIALANFDGFANDWKIWQSLN